MPSVKGITASGPIREVTFDWGGDEIRLRVRSSGISAGEVVDADLSTGKGLGEAEAMQQMVDTVAQAIAKSLVGWNVYLDEDETEEVRTYEDVLLLPTEFLMEAFLALKNHAEVDATGEASRRSAAG